MPIGQRPQALNIEQGVGGDIVVGGALSGGG